MAENLRNTISDKLYQKWRVRILISIILGYGVYYLCRQNFSMIMPSFMEEFGYSKTQLGAVISIASIVYGIGKFINGYISDKSNARYFMPIGLLCSAVITFILGFSNSLWFLGTFVIINHWFQSMGWPPVARMLTHWFSPKELGTKWAIGAASHQIGGAITLVLCGYLVTHFGWRYAFFIPSVIGLFTALFLFERLRDSPKELGFISVESYKGENSMEENNEEDCFTTSEIFRKVFINRNMWYVSLGNMCVYVVRTGILAWAPLFLIEIENISLEYAGWKVATCEAIGLPGGIIAGWISDKIGGRRGPVASVFMAFLAVSLTFFWLIPTGYFSTVALILIGFFVYGPQVLVGVASADFTSKKAIGTANGFAGTMGYLGSSLSGILVGALTDYWGWSGAFMFFILSSILGSIFFILTSNKTR